MLVRFPPTTGVPDERSARRLALICWTVLLAVVAGRLLLSRTVNHSVFFIFDTAGRSWIAGQELYGNEDNLFRYSPTIAAAFTPWTLLPQRAAEILWRIVSAAAFVVSLLYFFRTCVPSFDLRRRWLIVLGSLPLALMSVNNGQANILLGALLFFALADAHREKWNRCAAALAAAVLLKLWPIAAAGLLIVAFPRKLGLRFSVALTIGLSAPFLMQRWDYVLETYRSWLHYLPSDTRIDVNLLEGNRDLWHVNRLFGEPLSLFQYRLLQLGSGAALAAAVGWMHRRSRPINDVLTFIAFGGTVWMLVFGPATESCTYSLMGPLLAWASLDPTRETETRLERFLLLLSIGFFGVALLSVPIGVSRFIEAFGLQPIGAAVLFARTLVSGRPLRDFRPAVTTVPPVFLMKPQAA
jgi:hypothetical protein